MSKLANATPKAHGCIMIYNSTPAFTALSVMDEIGAGWLLSDVLAILGSLDIVLGEIDR